MKSISFPRVTVVGIEADGTILPAGREAIQQADVLLGWDRHLNQLDSSLKQDPIRIDSIDECVPELRSYAEGSSVVLLATGDPLFFGIGGYLAERIPSKNLRFIPARSCVQLAYAALKKDYSNALHHSLHGRSLDSLRTALCKKPDALTIFTEPDGNTPQAIYEFLEELGVGHYNFYLFGRLTGDDEPIPVNSVDDIPDDVDPLNLVVLERKDDSPVRNFSRPGVTDDFFQRSDDSMVTRFEVRMVCMGWLNVSGEETVWEIGAATGSISLESARLNPGARYHAIEKREDRYENLIDNIRKLETFNVIPHQQEAPECLAELPEPDRIFLGGSGGEIESILEAVDERINKNGLLVASFITLDNFHSAKDWFDGMSYQVTYKQVILQEDRQFGPGYTRWDQGPCIYLLRAKKNHD